MQTKSNDQNVADIVTLPKIYGSSFISLFVQFSLAFFFQFTPILIQLQVKISMSTYCIEQNCALNCCNLYGFCPTSSGTYNQMTCYYYYTYYIWGYWWIYFVIVTGSLLCLGTVIACIVCCVRRNRLNQDTIVINDSVSGASYQQNVDLNAGLYSPGQGVYNQNQGYYQNQGYNQNQGYYQNPGYNQNQVTLGEPVYLPNQSKQERYNDEYGNNQL